MDFNAHIGNTANQVCKFKKKKWPFLTETMSSELNPKILFSLKEKHISYRS